MVHMAILFDATECIGCRACQVACKQWNDLEADIESNPGSYDHPRDLSPNTWKKIEMREVERNDRTDWLFTMRSCYHCTDAACLEACPIDAISHTIEGFVVIDLEKCIGCGLCVKKCPFDIIVFVN